MSLFTVITIGVTLFVLLRVLLYFLRIISKGSVAYKPIIRIIPVFEFIVWSMYIFGAVYAVFSDYFYMPAIISAMALILSIIIGWYIMRDLISGMVLKSENAFEVGQYLKTTIGEGIIKKLGYLSVEMETTSGENIKISYSKLSNQVLVSPIAEQSNKHALITLKIPVNYSYTDVYDKLMRAINSTPWVVYNRPPEINIKPAKDDTLLVEIRFMSFSDEQTSLLKKFLEDYCKNNFVTQQSNSQN